MIKFLLRRDVKLLYVANQKEMQLLDRYTMEQLGLPGIVLMENAGASVVTEIIHNFPKSKTNVFVVAGSGNNGGDGFVIARRLIDYGYEVNLCLAVDEEKLKGDAKIHFNAYKSRNLPYFLFSKEGMNYFLTVLEKCTIVVDALLGTGVKGEVRSPFYEIIEQINRSNKIVISVDIPSGVNANTGEVTNIAVKATKTITFAMPKIGFFLGQGPQYIGQWKVKDISVPELAVERLQLQLPKLLDKETALKCLPKRPKHGHKGTFGHCIIVGGCVSYVGAPQYTAKAAFHTGVGLVTVAIPNDIYSVVAGACPECLFMPLPSKNGFFVKEAFDEMDFSKFQTVAIGPGIGRNLDGTFLLKQLFKKLSNQSVVIDADGLFFLKDLLEEVNSFKGDIIVTPHPGEMATLTGLTVKEIEQNRIEVAKDFALKHNLYVLLKGHRPIIATPNGEVWINPYGNDALGKGGSGDVLTGMITSFLTQGANALDAMLCASYYHAISAEQLSKHISSYGITPTDIIEYVRKQLLNVKE